MTQRVSAGRGGHTYASLLRDLRDRFRAAGIPDWEASAEWLAMDALGCTRTQLFSRGEHAADSEQAALLDAWANRRLAREPVQYILGYSEFCGLRIRVDSRVLVPRPETELLVEYVAYVARAGKAFDRPVRVLDVGTGSGCIALALASLLTNADVWGVDASSEALAVARENGKTLGLPVHWAQTDILTETPSGGPFTIIVSNPPYIPSLEAGEIMPEVAQFEPHEALFVDGDPLVFYHAILDHCGHLLEPGGYIFFEVNPDFASDVERLVRQHDFADSGIELDLAKRERIVWGRRDE